jgi:hypothetical protein
VGLYLGDNWKILPNLNLSPGLRWVRDTGRTDSDLPADAALNSAFPGYGNAINQPNKNFAPQLGVAWDPRNNGKTVIRAGAGLFWENVIFNNVLFDRPLRLASGAFLATPSACYLGVAQPISVPVSAASPSGIISVDSIEGMDPVTGQSYCTDTIGMAASAIAAFQNYYQRATPFNLNAPNPNYVDTLLSQGLSLPLGLFAPDYKSPRSVQINAGVERQIRSGLVFSADYLRNIETHTLLGVDVNHVGDVRFFNAAGALEAINSTNTAFGCPTGTGGINCAIAAGATMADYATNGLGTPVDTGSTLACPVDGCAFGGINKKYNSALFLEPVGRSVYNALQMKLKQDTQKPMRGVKSANFQIAYSLSRFVNPLAFQGTTAPSNPVGSNDQDFVLQAADNNNPLKYMGPSLLDRTHQISFGGYVELPRNLSFGLIGHVDSPLSSPVIIGNTGLAGDIFRTDFTGSGVTSDPLPGTTNGSFGRDFGLGGLNAAVNQYNATYANMPTPAGQTLINAGLMTLAQLQALGGVAPYATPAGTDQMPFTWLKTGDVTLSWHYAISERWIFEPSVGVFNVLNFANFNLPPGTMNGWVDLPQGSGSISTTPRNSAAAAPFRVGVGTGVYALGAPRVIEWGLKFKF